MPDLRFTADLFPCLDCSMALLSSPTHTHLVTLVHNLNRRQLRNGNLIPVVLPLILLPQVNSSVRNNISRLPRLPSHITLAAPRRTLRPLVKLRPAHINSSTALLLPISRTTARVIRRPQASNLTSTRTLETRSHLLPLGLHRVIPLLEGLTNRTTLSKAKHRTTLRHRLSLPTALRTKAQARVRYHITRLHPARRLLIRALAAWTTSNMKVNEGLLLAVCAKILISTATSCAVTWLVRSISIRIV